MRNFSISLLVALILPVMAGPVGAVGLLDGRSFAGKIGPVENPDLDDRLFFESGHFWSDISTRCGFVPGIYEAEETGAGIRFTGTLESDTRGRFDYDGLVAPDGTISVSIRWERRRWYWTSRREIVFDGAQAATAPVSLSSIREQLNLIDPDSNPACARF